jgi:hypothetical protein
MMNQELEQSKQDLTIREYSEKNHYSERHVRRLIKQGKITARQITNGGKWLIPANQRTVEQRNNNPIEILRDEAYAKCKNGDHSWFDDVRFQGLAFRCESNEAGYFIKTCYFCGRSEFTF